MKKIFNNKVNIVNDMLSGYVKAHSDRVKFSESNQRIIIRSKNKNINKVPLLIGNGSGHEPIAVGWIGEGLRRPGTRSRQVRGQVAERDGERLSRIVSGRGQVHGLCRGHPLTGGYGVRALDPGLLFCRGTCPGGRF